MEPLKLNIKPHAASTDEKEKTVAALKNNEEVRRLQDKIHFPETALEHDTYKFVAWLKELEKCRGCKALSACKQKKEGYRRGLRYDDGLLQEVIEACPYRIAKTQLEKHRRNYTVADMGDALLQARFETIRLQGEPDGYVRAVQEALTCVRQRKGCLLYGPMGAGKTYLGVCAANYMAMRNHRVAFVHYPSYCERLNNEFRSGEYREEFDRLRFADLLVLDDIGAEEVNERNRAVLLAILDRRMQDEKMTWLTSNADFKALENHFLHTYKGEDRLQCARVMERIRALCRPIFVAHADRRILFDQEVTV